MGSWGVSLYSNDFAADLRTAVRAILRLPLDPDRLAEIAIGVEPQAARNQSDEDHTIFWLVLADQFARQGVKSDEVIEQALRIIDTGRDLDMQSQLGQSAAGLEKRRRVLVELRERIVNPPPSGARKVMRSPQPFVMDVGDALAYPTCFGRCRNPYAAKIERLKIYGPAGGQVWTPDGWGAAVIIDRGLTFGFLAWYRPVVVRHAFAAAPDTDALRDADCRLEAPGTCSPTHFKRIGIARVGKIDIDAEKVRQRLGLLAPGDAKAINDISIANCLDVIARGGRPSPTRVSESTFRLEDLT
jgi:hypothetical protein